MAKTLDDGQIQQVQPHIAVVPFPFASHPSSLLSIINRLAASAPNALFTFFSTPQSNNALFFNSTAAAQEERPNNIKPYNVSDGVDPDGHHVSPAGIIIHPEERIELFLNAADANIRKAVEAAVADTGRTLTCLITDAFLYFAADMAQDWNVPWIPCCAFCPYALCAHLYTDILREKIGILNPNEQQQQQEEEKLQLPLQFIPGMSKIRVADLPQGIVFGNLDSLFSIMLHQMGRQLPRAAAVFINSFEELHPEITNHLKTKFDDKFFSVGPFNKLLASQRSSSSSSLTNDKYGCLAWLDKQKKKPASVAYISFGTAATPSPKEVVAIAEALETSKMAFIWSLQHGSQTHLPNGFLQRTKSDGMVVDWAPQVDILAHEAVGVFITHSGWASILECTAAGVPMIGRPFLGDNFIAGRAMEQVWEVGVIVDGGICTKNGLLSSLDLILCHDDDDDDDDDKGKKIKDNVAKLKQLYQTAIGPGGSSLKNHDALVAMILSISY